MSITILGANWASPNQDRAVVRTAERGAILVRKDSPEWVLFQEWLKENALPAFSVPLKKIPLHLFLDRLTDEELDQLLELRTSPIPERRHFINRLELTRRDLDSGGATRTLLTALFGPARTAALLA